MTRAKNYHDSYEFWAYEVMTLAQILEDGTKGRDEEKAPKALRKIHSDLDELILQLEDHAKV